MNQLSEVAMTLGIMSARKKEIQDLIAALGAGTEVTRVGTQEFHKGSLWGKSVVVVFSRWEKVTVAATAATLINQFRVDRIIFVGVAGAVDQTLNPEDLMAASSSGNLAANIRLG
jgi:adenosylhomocysteine nucleosidase